MRAGMGVVAMLLIGAIGASDADPTLLADSRLTRPVALRSYYETLRTTIGRMAEAADVRLTVDDGVGALTVCAVADQTTVREAMTLLASTCQLQWRRVGNGPEYSYRLYRDLKTRREIAEARLSHWRLAARELDVQVDGIMRFGARFERTEPRLVREEVVALREAAGALTTGRERFAAEQQALCASIAASPMEWPLVLAYRSLPGDAKARLLRGERVLMASPGLPGAVPLPEPVRSALGAARPGLRGGLGTHPAPVGVTAESEIVEFRLELRDRLVLYARAARRAGQDRAPRLSLPIRQLTPSHTESFVPPLDCAGKVSADNPADLAKLSDYRLLSRKRSGSDVLTHTQGVTVAEIMRSWHEREPRIKVVGPSPWLALTFTGGATPVSARDVMTGLGAGGVRPPIGRILAEIAARGRMDIHLQRDGWITLKSTTPYDWEHQSIDPQWLSEVFGSIAEGTETFGPAVAARAVSRLTIDQARALADFQLGYLAEGIPAGELSTSYGFWRLLSELPASNRSELLSGRPIRYSGLGPVGREAFRGYLTGALGEGDGPMEAELSPAGLNQLELQCQPPGSPPPLPLKGAPSHGTYRSVELRLMRPPIPLLKRQVRCHWDRP